MNAQNDDSDCDEQTWFLLELDENGQKISYIRKTFKFVDASREYKRGFINS